MEGFTVWVTGPAQLDVEVTAQEIEGRLRARALPTELLDARTPGVETLSCEGAIACVAGSLARHGVATVIALPMPRRAARDRARGLLGRMIEVHVPSADTASEGYEAPLRAEVEVAVPQTGVGSGADHTLRVLELLGFLEAEEDSTFSVDEERQVIKRLKAFGYL